MTMISFPSLATFDRIYSSQTYDDGQGNRGPRASLSYRRRIKLHGTNAGIQVRPDGSVIAQSRRGILSLEHDNHNFALWLSEARDVWSRAAGEEVVTFFGEWAGPGCARGDVISQTDAKRFFVFSIGLGEVPHSRNPEMRIPRWVITDPEAIENLLPSGLDRDFVRVLPWEDDAPTVFDFSDDARLRPVLDRLNTETEALNDLDPYVQRTFGLSGPGEGYILTPEASRPGDLSGEDYARLTFKAKTEKHRVRKQGRPATAKEPMPESVTAFLDVFCTGPRLSQAIEEVCGGTPDRKHTGQVISWMLGDILKEAGPEIDALLPSLPEKRRNGFQKILGSAIAEKVRPEFFSRLPGAPVQELLSENRCPEAPV